MPDFATIGQQVKAQYPAYADYPDEMIGQLYLKKTNPLQYQIYANQIQTEQDLYETGAKADIQAEKELGVSRIKREEEYQFEKEHPDLAPSEGEEKKKTAFSATTNFVELLEQRFSEAGGGEYKGAGARVSGAKKGVAGALGLNSAAKTYNDQRKGFAATLKQITGDTGVLTEKDYQRLAGLIPSLGATPEEAQNKFNDLRSQIAASFGGEKKETAYAPPPSKGGLPAATLPGLTGLYESEQRATQEQGLGALPRQSLETLIPALKLGKPEGRQAASEVSTILGLAGLLKAGAQKIGGLTVKGALQKRATTAGASKATVSGNKVYKAAEETVRRSASETDLPKAEKLLAQAKKGLGGKKFGMEQLLDKLAQYNKAYTTAGRAGKGASALVNDALSKAARQEVQRVAPEVFASQQALGKAYGIEKFAKRSIFPAAIGAGASIPAYFLLRKLLGQGGQ